MINIQLRRIYPIEDNPYDVELIQWGRESDNFVTTLSGRR